MLQARVGNYELKLTKLAVLLQHWHSCAPPGRQNRCHWLKLWASIREVSHTYLLGDALHGVQALCRGTVTGRSGCSMLLFWWNLPMESRATNHENSRGSPSIAAAILLRSSEPSSRLLSSRNSVV